MRDSSKKGGYIKLKIENLALIAIGTLFLALGTAAFLIPFELVTGGISGIAIIVSTFAKGGFLSIDGIIALLTWTSFFIGLIFLGKSFALKTLLSAILYPIFISAFIESGLADRSLALLSFPSSQIIAALLGGAFVGFGCALSFIGGGSTGGVDILALVLCKDRQRLKISHVMLFIDALIIILGAFAIAERAKTALGIFSAITAAFSIEMTLRFREKIFSINWRGKKIDNFKK